MKNRPSHPSRPLAARRSFLSRLTLLVALAASSWLGMAQLRTPKVVEKSAPATEFSAARAMEDLRVLARESRAIGTPGHLAAREYLVNRIEALGLEAEVQTTPVHVRFPDSPGFSAGVVNNVVTRVRGTDSTGAIVVNAHYDSGTTGPGASDCGSCVVTALEAMRTVVNGPPLRNDVIFVFSDGEENGDLGASAFATQHRWASDVRLAINYEAQGSSGPAFLYATSEGDGWLVSEFFDVAPNLVAYSWIGAITEIYPSGQLECDLAEYMKGGVQGLGFLYTGDTMDYHTVRDNVEQIDPGSIQQEGGYTVAFLRHFGGLDISELPRWDNRVFFNILPGVVADYPYGWVAPLSVALTLLGLLLIGVGFRRGELHLRPLALATGAVAVGGFVIVACSVLLWVAIKAINPVYDVILIGHYQARLYTAAFILFNVSMVGVLHVAIRRWGPAHLIAAAFLVWLPFLWLMTLVLPAMSYIATWPLLFALLPLGWLAVTGRSTDWRYATVLAVAAAPGIVLLPGTLYQVVGLLNRFEGAMGLPLFGAVGVFVVPVLLLLLPHYELLAGRRGEQRWVVPAALGLMTVLLIGWCNLTAGFDAERPRPDHIAYSLDADADRASWLSFDRHLDEWTAQFVGPDAKRRSYETTMWGTFQAFTAEAPVVGLSPPEVAVEEQNVEDGRRTLKLRLFSSRGAPEMRVRVVADGPIVAAALDERVLELDDYAPGAEGVLQFNYVNVPREGVPLSLTVQSDGKVRVIVEDSTLGLPASLDPPPRPDDTMPAPSFRRDATEVRKSFAL